MPMVWNAQADAQLLLGIIQVYDVKVSGEKLNEVAKMMGADCTPKALTHRIAKLKNMAKTGTLDGSEKPAEEGTKKAAAPKGKGKGGKAAKKADTPVEGGDDDDKEAPKPARAKSTKPRKATVTKRKKAESESEDELTAKKVKDEGDAEDEF